MTWPAFLAQIQNCTEIQLVGPLYDKPFRSSDPVIFVDGGARFRSNGALSIAVGDGDSGTELDHLLPEEKDYSDLAFVLRGLPLSVRHLALHGFRGGRRDHEWAVFGEVNRFLTAREESTAELTAADQPIVFGFRGTHTAQIKGTFSVMALQPTKVRIAGECKYLFNGTLEALSSHGLSNEGRGSITVAAEAPVFIFPNVVS